MPRPKFEDYQAPWEKDGTEPDPAKLKKLLWDKEGDVDTARAETATVKQERDTLKGERDTLQTKVNEHDRAGESEMDKLRRERDEALARPSEKDPAAELRSARLEVALEKGLTLQQANRLAGSTKDELLADADAYMTEHGLTAPGGGETPPSQGGTTGPLRGGIGGVPEGDEYDPAKLTEGLPPRR